ncbi:helix-turn-helix domain-containing protein [Neobacillus rhizophilus]|uniref:Helix-turn-helix domain-containing protein n=1 Tax=Neobacillus rhizophilus TaxID=2833579 RepID=A0A942TYW4_9BACI|nr:helix-turn-helix domain-containing protein [Neobacillus rhizophilus]MBS4211345.1 helix-turn-helix domain-containing protein [Neobacillus rhizophilus]MBU8916763.1 helix-turn-helix domain-containing protein [Bacillus sp. FJAT-29953]
MEGKWLIADRDLNEREGLKWMLKTSSIPVANILSAADYQEFIVLFEKEAPEVVLIELDMISKEDWPAFRDLIQIYEPILLLTSAEATFEKARLAIDLQALDLMIKPFSTVKIKSAYQKASRKLSGKLKPNGPMQSTLYKDITYETLFISQTGFRENYHISAFKAEEIEMNRTLHSFLLEYSFKDLHGIFPLSDMVILLFKESCTTIMEQCRKAMRRWEEDFSDSLAIVVHKGNSSMPLNEKYRQTRKMLDFTYYKGYRQVVEFEYSPKWVYLDPFLTPPEQRNWIDMLTNYELEKIKKCLYDEFLHLETPYPDPGLVRIRLTSILAQIRRFMKTYTLEEDEHFEREYRYIFNSILYDTVLYRTVQNLILFMQKIFQGVEANIRSLKNDPIERGIAYMEANFSNSQLRLEEVAQYVERNPSYFSHLITSTTGSSFTDVLTRIRMKEAKRLLIETNKPINEIAAMAGFQNSNYFSRLFKDLMGSSPREYRKEMKL